jgi:hypothetical protein
LRKRLPAHVVEFVPLVVFAERNVGEAVCVLVLQEG